MSVTLQHSQRGWVPKQRNTTLSCSILYPLLPLVYSNNNARIRLASLPKSGIGSVKGKQTERGVVSEKGDRPSKLTHTHTQRERKRCIVCERRVIYQRQHFGNNMHGFPGLEVPLHCSTRRVSFLNRKLFLLQDGDAQQTIRKREKDDTGEAVVSHGVRGFSDTFR